MNSETQIQQIIIIPAKWQGRKNWFLAFDMQSKAIVPIMYSYINFLSLKIYTNTNAKFLNKF